MELKNTRIIHSSERGDVLLGESDDGRLIIKKKAPHDKELLKRLSEINSPYISRVVEYDDEYIYFEYTEGTSLSERSAPSTLLYNIFRELCSGLSALHSAGVIHRDIKPSNIILGNDGHIKIIDFDAARIKKPNADKDTLFIGTDGFAAPEQFGFMQTDERSDIYSFGVTAKLLLAENFNSSPYKLVIQKCMRFDPDERYSSVTQVKRDLFLCRYVNLFAAGCLAVVGAAVIVCLISFQNRNIPIQSEQQSSQDVFSESNASTSATSKSSSTSYESRTSSTEQTSSSSYSSVSTSPESTNSEVSSSSSIETSASTSSDNADSSTSPNESFIIPEDSKRPIGWYTLSLPKGTPKFADAVSHYNKQNNFVLVKWDKMNRGEADSIVARIKQWLGVEEPEYEFDEPNYLIFFKNDRYEVCLDLSNQKHVSYQASLSIKTIDEDESLLFSDELDEKYIPNVGEIRWDELSLPDEVPKLSDNVSSYYDENEYRWSIEWEGTTSEQAARMAMLLSDWLECDYTVYSYDIEVQWLINSSDRNTGVEWQFDGNLTVTIGKWIFE